MELSEQQLRISDQLLIEVLKFKNKNPEFTCSFRQKNNGQRLEKGFWFQGGEYIFLPLFKRGDGKNRTNNIGLEIRFDKETINSFKTIKLVKRADDYSENEIKFLDSLARYLSIEWNKNGEAEYKFEALDSYEHILDFYFENFRNQCLKLLAKFKIEDQYLISQKEFYKSLSKIEKLRKASYSCETEYKEWFLQSKSKATWATYRDALTNVLREYLSDNNYKFGDHLPPEIHFSVFHVQKIKAIKKLINQLEKVDHFIPNSRRSKDNYDHLLSALRNYELFITGDFQARSIFKDMEQSNYPLNQILYGPPGTGKTYKTTELAVKIAEPKKYDEITRNNDSYEKQHQFIKELYDNLVKSKRIGFTTFHQSYSYEDFIEGIRVDSDDEDNIKYKVEDGVFKELVVLANDSTFQLSPDRNINNISDKEIWKMSLGDTSKGDDKYQNCIENNYIGMNYGKDIDFSDAKSQDDIINLYQEKKDHIYTKKDYPVTSVFRFKNEMKVGDLIIVTDGNRKYRAIGEVTGEYEFNVDDDFLFFQTRKVKWLKVLKNSLPKDPLFKKGISQMTLYKLNAESIDRSYLAQILSERSEVKKHVLIIDEINRGNISKIFGELITLLENDKRAEASDQRTAILPYSKDKFSVPQNLYIIGTMNTADKSLAQMDLALRRRFDFIEMLPDESLLDELNVFDINVSDLLKTINQRIEVLLDRDHLIGHSYFWSLKALASESELQLELAKIFKNKIIPLLQEYFFADWERIRWVLNDQNKAKEHQLIHMQEDENSLLRLFGEDVADQLSDKRYQINEAALSLAEAYQGILGSS